MKSTIDELRRVLQYISKGYTVPKIIMDVVYQVAVREVEEKGKVVLIKRDPNIDRDRIQSSYVKVIEGETLEIHPAIVGGFGADFDGDAMAVYAPLSQEAQDEAREKMLTAVSTMSVNSPQFSLGKEVLTGLFTITYEESSGTPKKIDGVEEAESLHIATPVIYKGIKTTAGRVIFNSCIPTKYQFINEPVNKKRLTSLINSIIANNKRDYILALDKLMKLGFKYATMYPKSVSLDMLEIPPKLMELKIKLSKEKDLLKQDLILKEMEKEMMDHFKKNVPHLYEQIESGAARGGEQIRQVMVAKGLIKNAKGDILPPITKSINEGYTPEEYFEASAGSRKGLIDRVHNTSFGGYTYRKSIYALGTAIANVNIGNCDTRRTLNIKLTNDLFKRMNGRYIQDKKGNISPVTKDMIGEIIPLRSPVFCKTFEICRACYGDLLRQINSKNVGIIAAQQVCSLSEKIMKCSTGLISGIDGNMYSMEDIWNNYV